MNADAVADLLAWLVAVISGIVKTPAAVSVELVGNARSTLLLAVTVDEQDVGRLLGVNSVTIDLVQRLSARYAALRDFRVSLVAPQRHGRR